MENPLRSRCHFLWPIVLGLLCFWFVCGPRTLNPLHIAWLLGDAPASSSSVQQPFDPKNVSWVTGNDAAQHYLGWAFYRNTQWTFPVGLNPDWGLENASSISYADALPLFALPFKLFSAWLPFPFQYYGIWHMLCFVAQALFAWRLFRGMSVSVWSRIMGTFLVTFSPIMICRMSQHQSLAGQFLLIWAFGLYLLPSVGMRWKEWLACLVCSIAIHPYFTAMLSVFWIADAWKFTISTHSQRIRQLFLPALLTALVCLGVMWQLGLIGAASAPSGLTRFGFYRFNLNGFFNPMREDGLLPPLPVGGRDYEGYAYLGGGVLLLGFLVGVLRLLRVERQVPPTLPPLRPLIVALLFLFLLAVSSTLGVGSYDYEWLSVGSIPLLETFRSSGRFIWPIWYAILIFLIRDIDSSIWEKRRSRAALLVFWALICTVQVFDLYGLTHSIRENMMRENALPSFGLSLTTDKWSELRNTYDTIRLLHNPGPSYGDWKKVSFIAANWKMKTNVVYLARQKHDELAEQTVKDDFTLAQGAFDPKTVYIVMKHDFGALSLSPALQRHTVTELDGLYLLLPEWAGKPHRNTWEQASLWMGIPEIQFDTTLSTAQHGDGLPYLERGWPGPEEGGVWSDGAQASLIFCTGERLPKVVSLALFPFLSEGWPVQEVELWVNGTKSATVALTKESVVDVEVTDAVWDSVSQRHGLYIVLKLKNAVSPKTLGLGEDMRMLGVNLKSITVR